MVRFVQKGGTWKNTEDEILKAAVMKYGVNQWARISSLLTKKNPSQCKSRWIEWLDPSIKKIPWTTAEQQLLLQLARMLPNQWRTIAPQCGGRTATQCLQKYEQLMDAAAAASAATAAGVTVDSSSSSSIGIDSQQQLRRLRMGEIDPQPESKPARPDAVDMDEDEKEMLSEARARLANTKGKKAKRKQREKALEEAKRLALLQKQRELTAAGISSSSNKRKNTYRVSDLNVEVPFEKFAPAGLYNVTAENRRSDVMSSSSNTAAAFVGKLLSAVEGERRDTIEERERQKDAKRQKLMRETALPDAIAALHSNDAMMRVVVERVDLLLPAPVASDSDIRMMAKWTPQQKQQHKHQQQQLQQQQQQRQMQQQKQPQQDAILLASQQVLAISQQPAPLRAAADALMHDIDSDDDSSSSNSSSNLVHNRQRHDTLTAMLLQPANTLMQAVTPTNTILGSSNNSSVNSGISKQQLKQQHKQQAASLLNAFSSLPKPENDYLLTAPADSTNNSSASNDDNNDAEHVAAVRAAAVIEEAARQYKLTTSTAVQQRLPRLSTPTAAAIAAAAATSTDDIELMIQTEMIALVQRDNSSYSGKRSIVASSVVVLPLYSEAALAAAQALINKQLVTDVNAQLTAAALATAAVTPLSLSDVHHMLASVDIRGITQQQLQQLESSSNVQQQQQHTASLQQFVSMLSAKNNKAEGKLSVQLGGYCHRVAALTRESVSLHTVLQQQQLDLCSFESLLSHEASVAIPIRLREARAMLAEAQQRHSGLQKQYDEMSFALAQQ